VRWLKEEGLKVSNCWGRDAGAIVVEGAVDDSGKLSKD